MQARSSAHDCSGGPARLPTFAGLSPRRTGTSLLELEQRRSRAPGLQDSRLRLARLLPAGTSPPETGTLQLGSWPGQARQWSRQRVGTMMDEVGRPRRPKDKGQSGGQSERGKVRTGLLPPQAFFPPPCLPSSARQLDFYFWQVAPRGSRSINMIRRLHRVNNHDDAPRGHVGVPARLHIPGLIFSPLRLLLQDRPPPPQT